MQNEDAYQDAYYFVVRRPSNCRRNCNRVEQAGNDTPQGNVPDRRGLQAD
ncbi:MAG: hypothetical protein ACLR8Y_08090 [Alistipes indistinctus]